MSKIYNPREVAIFNGFPFHYEVMGYLINWCVQTGRNVTVYTETKNDYGWLQWYEDYHQAYTQVYAGNAPTFQYRPYREFPHECARYDLIFLPTDDDKYFDDAWLNLYDVRQRIIKINHMPHDRRPQIKRFIDIRPYFEQVDNAWALPIFPMSIKPKVDGEVIKVYVTDGIDPARHDAVALKAIARQPNVHLHCVGRYLAHTWLEGNTANPITFHTQIPALEMIQLMASCHYYFYGVVDGNGYNDKYVSGHLSTAFSCGTKIIMRRYTQKYFGFTSCLLYDQVEDILPLTWYDNRDVLAERDHLTGMLNAVLQERFLQPVVHDVDVERPPTDTMIPRVFYSTLMLDQSWYDKHPGWEFYVHPRLNPWEVIHRRGGVYVDHNLCCARNIEELLMVDRLVLVKGYVRDVPAIYPDLIIGVAGQPFIKKYVLGTAQNPVEIYRDWYLQEETKNKLIPDTMVDPFTRAGNMRVPGALYYTYPILPIVRDVKIPPGFVMVDEGLPKLGKHVQWAGVDEVREFSTRSSVYDDDFDDGYRVNWVWGIVVGALLILLIIVILMLR